MVRTYVGSDTSIGWDTHTGGGGELTLLVHYVVQHVRDYLRGIIATAPKSLLLRRMCAEEKEII